MATYTVYTGQINRGTAYDDNFLIASHSFRPYFYDAFIDAGAGYDILQVSDRAGNWKGQINPGSTSYFATVRESSDIYSSGLQEYVFSTKGIEEIRFIDKSFQVDNPPASTPEPASVAQGLILNMEDAEHLYRVNGNSKKITYYIDSNGIVGEESGLANAAKIDKSERKHIQDQFNILNKYTQLGFKRENKLKNSTFDVYKVSSFQGEPNLLGYMSPADWGNYIVFRDNKDSNYEKQTITHEIGHGVGLSHPFQKPKDTRYDMSDTVMSYNTVTNSNGSTWVGGFRRADIEAAAHIWKEGVKSTSHYKPTSTDGTSSHKTVETEFVEDFESPALYINSKKRAPNFQKYWTKNKGKILGSFDENLLKQYSGIEFTAKKKLLDIDFTDWSGKSAGHEDFQGFVEINGNSKDNTFVVRGPKLFKDSNGLDIFANDLLINGGEGEDTVVIPNGGDFFQTRTFVGFGEKGREIYFEGKREDYVKDNGKVMNIDREQGLTIFETVEYIKIDDYIYTFDELYGLVENGSF